MSRMTCFAGVLCAFVSPAIAAAPVPAPTKTPELSDFVRQEAAEKIAAALPTVAAARPAKPRKVLVLTGSAEALHHAATTRNRKFVPHASAPHCAEAVVGLGRKTGAFEAVVVTDADGFTAENLKSYDAIVLANVYLNKKFYGVPVTGGREEKMPMYLREEEKPIFAARRKAFEEFVRSGKGLVGIHHAAASALDWPEYNVMIGGTHFGHAWWAHQTVPLKLDDSQSPLCAAFAGKGPEISDDIYYFTAPYSRERVHVLLSVDTAKAPKSLTDDRPDGDYPVSWIKPYGQGRVFYTSLGHREETFQNAAFLKHLLAGIQYALGDLKADASPGKSLPPRSDFVAMPGFTPLFDGEIRELTTGRKQWRPSHGVIDWGMGPDPCTSCKTKNAYGDYTLRVDFRMPCVSDSGVFVKGGVQVNIWAVSEGSGQLHAIRLPPGPDGKPQSTDPASCQDRPIGEWNTMLITYQKNGVAVVLNGIKVMNALLPEVEPPYERTITLQYHREPLKFKNIYIRRIEGEK